MYFQYKSSYLLSPPGRSRMCLSAQEYYTNLVVIPPIKQYIFDPFILRTRGATLLLSSYKNAQYWIPQWKLIQLQGKFYLLIVSLAEVLMEWTFDNWV